MLKVHPLQIFCPPLPIGCVYVGSGSVSFGLKPSVWLNPFAYSEEYALSLGSYRSFARIRPDLRSWLAPLGKASVVVCDCNSRSCGCHARVLLKLVQENGTQIEVCAVPELGDDRDCPEFEPGEAECDMVGALGSRSSNETTRGINVQKSVGYPSSWSLVISDVRAAPQRIFWEVFAGCAILITMFLERNWCCGPPMDVEIDPTFKLLNPAFLCVLLGLIFEGRVALLHVAPPCSSFPWAVNRWWRYAMLSRACPEGFWNPPVHRAEKVRLGNALAEFSLKLFRAQEKVHGWWQWEQPLDCLMFVLRDIHAFVYRVGVYLSEAYVSAFGMVCNSST